MKIFLILALLAGGGPLSAADIQFRADFYERDLRNNTVRGRGRTWIQSGNREITADEMEVNFKTKRALVKGHVHVTDGRYQLWSEAAQYDLESESADLQEAVMLSGQMVVSGASLKKIGRDQFQIEEGQFSNCNTIPISGPEAAGCAFDWKVYGRRISLVVEEYVSVWDGLLFVRNLPALYVPFLLLPTKTKRQSGILPPKLAFSQTLGTGLGIPYFWAIAPWQDLTIFPMYFTIAGYHLDLNYRYAYSGATHGEVNPFLLQKSFNSYRPDPEPGGSTVPQYGIAGEWGLNLRNQVGLWGRAHTRQRLRLVSDPYYTRDYAGDFAVSPEYASLRSHWSLTLPWTHSLTYIQWLYHQNLIIATDRANGVDRGATMLLPSIGHSIVLSPVLSRYLGFELDAQLNNYTRPGLGFDAGPENAAADGSFHVGNYLRTGRRLKLEPRMVFSAPVPFPFQLQPTLRTVLLGYNFDYPAPSSFMQSFGYLEIPFSGYVSKTFTTPWEGFARIRHLVQPRVTYAATVWQQSDQSHPFFYSNPALKYSNPRFDITDYLFALDYVRFEFINRLLRKNPSNLEGERFFLLQLSEQYNFKLNSFDPRFAKRMGPIELLTEFTFWRLTGQLQATYQLETTPLFDLSGAPALDAAGAQQQIRENDWSSTLTYRAPEGDSISLNTRVSVRGNSTQTQRLTSLSFTKSTPWFFDFDGGLEYSLTQSQFKAYRLGLMIRTKPRNCWQLYFQAGRDTTLNQFVLLTFQLNLGAAGVAQQLVQR